MRILSTAIRLARWAVLHLACRARDERVSTAIRVPWSSYSATQRIACSCWSRGKVLVSPGVIHPNRSVAWVIQLMSVTSAIRFQERRCSMPIFRSCQMAPQDVAGRRGPLEGGEDDVAVVLGGDPPACLETDHTCW